MSQRVSPTLIGLFVVGALALGVVGVGAFGSGQFFEQRTTFISYFDESVNGLDVGAPVKFKGVPIGEVTDINLRVDLENETFQVPVQYAVNLDPVTDTTGARLNLDDPALLRDQIEDGLRAQLQLESIVTGKLYVELTYISDPDSAVYAQGPPSRLSIPTELSPLAKLGEGASGLVTNLRQFDVTQINENLVTFLVNANDKLEALDAEAINRSALSTIESVREVVESKEVRTALQDMPKATERLRATIKDAQALIQRLDRGVEPTADELEKTSRQLRATLKRMRRTMDEVDQTLSPNSGIGYQMNEALSNLSEATEALRVLVQSLERNPSMFLRGREEPPPSNQQ
ncbi:MlaD family protein [Salinibacter ruber]|uniref:Paraquat-inducible protein B n=1 Tax=Salinibacter ruber TaxID=146919 RepID=A0A9X2UM50_9BACT|nr:MlaD family protein [Salinibacter ruber]MBB4090671.1 paraquat-inducible protein B [Salinibacter ruber]MCS3610165.1 paraquat-inducible protein B [Salinibacter ruber]MCS3616015.1 paraquat-inducible protein B [Salinibacter ruber]MCS3647776.1 paraquat-inducible protein B [Salinibacter ruber]MCS3675342.1 paraquat-inducible protein B [Salinibacter ruber]